MFLRLLKKGNILLCYLHYLLIQCLTECAIQCLQRCQLVFPSVGLPLWWCTRLTQWVLVFHRSNPGVETIKNAGWWEGEYICSQNTTAQYRLHVRVSSVMFTKKSLVDWWGTETAKFPFASVVVLWFWWPSGWIWKIRTSEIPCFVSKFRTTPLTAEIQKYITTIQRKMALTCMPVSKGHGFGSPPRNTSSLQYRHQPKSMYRYRPCNLLCMLNLQTRPKMFSRRTWKKTTRKLPRGKLGNRSLELGRPLRWSGMRKFYDFRPRLQGDVRV